MTRIYYDYYYYFECCSYISKTKKCLSFEKGPSWVWFISLCVFCFLLIIFFLCPVGLWLWWFEITEAVLSRLPPDRPSRLLKKKKKKSINICIVRCLRELQGQRSGNVGGREEDWPVNTHYIEEKEKKRHQRFRPHMQRYRHTTM